MEKRGWLLFILGLLFATCSDAQGGADSLSALEGRFVNWHVVPSNELRFSLWEIVNPGKREATKAPDSSVVILSKTANGRLKITLWNNGVILKEHLLKGNYKNGWFERRRYLRMVPIPFIYFTWYKQKVRMQIDAAGRLRVEEYKSGFAWAALLLHAGSTYTHEIRFAAAP